MEEKDEFCSLSTLVVDCKGNSDGASIGRHCQRHICSDQHPRRSGVGCSVEGIMCHFLGGEEHKYGE